MPPRTRVKRPPRTTTGKVEPVTVRRIEPQALVDIGHIRTDPLPERDIPQRLRSVHPVAASVGYRLAGANWDRVRPLVNQHGVITDLHTVIVS